jgi:CAAX prenyl protease-like protein
VASLSWLSRPAFARVAPFALFIAFVAAQSIVGDSPALVVARGVAVALALAILWRRYAELRPLPAKVPAKEWLIAIGVGWAVFGLWITFDHGWAAIGPDRPGFTPLGADGRVDGWLAGLRLAGVALVVPVAEELFWRSFLLRWIDSRDFLALDPRRATPQAIAITCALFASEHSLWFAGLAAGLAYTWVYARSGNLWIPITSHAITNGTLGLWILATGNWRFW